MKVASASDSSLYDQSDAAFTIDVKHITVSAPVGGEVWAIGSTHTITWDYELYTGNVQINLYDAFTSTQKRITPYSIPISGKSWSWSIGKFYDNATIYDGSRYRIRVVSSVDNTFGQSVADFSVGTGAPSLTLTSPNGGEVWAPGSTHAVTWNQNMVTGEGGKAGIYLINTSTWVTTTLTNTVAANAGTYSWAIPAGQAIGDTYQVRIIALEQSTLDDYSNASFVIASSPSTVHVTSVNTATTWTRGTAHPITWTSTSVSKVYVYLVNTATPGWDTTDLAGGAINGSLGTFSWNIPAGTAPGTKYLLRVFSKANVNVTDYSDAYLTIN
jgi:hypothetical protein